MYVKITNNQNVAQPFEHFDMVHPCIPIIVSNSGKLIKHKKWRLEPKPTDKSVWEDQIISGIYTLKVPANDSRTYLLDLIPHYAFDDSPYYYAIAVFHNKKKIFVSQIICFKLEGRTFTVNKKPELSKLPVNIQKKFEKEIQKISNYVNPQ